MKLTAMILLITALILLILFLQDLVCIMKCNALSVQPIWVFQWLMSIPMSRNQGDCSV